MSQLPREPKVYDDGRTVQSFKDSCDINKIVARAARAGTLSHLEQFGGRYGDFADFDYQDAMNRIAEAKSIFHALPAELRREFGNDPGRFLSFVNDPQNAERLPELLQPLAEPGRQLPSAVRGGRGQQAVQAESAVAPNEAPAQPAPEAPSDGATEES